MGRCVGGAVAVLVLTHHAYIQRCTVRCTVSCTYFARDLVTPTNPTLTSTNPTLGTPTYFARDLAVVQNLQLVKLPIKL